MILETITIIIYSVSLLLIFMYALAQLNLLFNYLKAQKLVDKSPKYNFTNPGEIPCVFPPREVIG